MKKRGFIALLLAFGLSYSCAIEEIITQGDTDTLYVYQTDTVLSEERILEDIKKLIDPEQTKEEYAKMGDPPLMRSHIAGADWHSTVYTGLKGHDI
mgnify:CR=1 FL=1